MNAPPGPELTAEERACKACRGMTVPNAWGCCECGRVVKSPLFAERDAALSRAEAAEEARERDLQIFLAHEPGMAAESRLAAAVELLRRWALREPVTTVPPGFSDVGTDTRAFLSTAPAQAAEPEWRPKYGAINPAAQAAEPAGPVVTHVSAETYARALDALRECRSELEESDAHLDLARAELEKVQHLKADYGQQILELKALRSKEKNDLDSTRAELDLLKQDYAGVVADRHGLSAEFATAREALAEIHKLTGRGDGHGSVKATLACIVDSIVSRSSDMGESEADLATARERIIGLEAALEVSAEQSRHDQAALRSVGLKIVRM